MTQYLNTERVAISIHAPRTGSDIAILAECAKRRISIHAPRTGSDRGCRKPVRRVDISIHAPRTGSDAGTKRGTSRQKGFQSTLPARGATLVGKEELYRRLNFNPRSPHGERRLRQYRAKNRQRISIHAPRTGSDCNPSDKVHTL